MIATFPLSIPLAPTEVNYSEMDSRNEVLDVRSKLPAELAVGDTAAAAAPGAADPHTA